jgi:hypothetical protein
MRTQTILYGLLSGCLLLAGCSGRQGSHENEEQVLAKYRPRADALSETLHRVAPNLPKRVNPKSNSSIPKLDPPMSLRFGKDENTHIVAEPQLPEIQSTPQFDAWTGDSLVLFLRWLDARKGKPSSELQGDPLYSSQDAERFLATKYIVVLRVADYAPPKAIDPNDLKAGYKGGRAALDIFVVSLDSAQVVAAFSVSAATSKEVWIEYAKKDPTSEVAKQMEGAALRSMENDAQAAIVQALKDKLDCLTM